ncbi:MAG: hypothetical protein ACI4U1_00715 [Anaerovoracaceae bacterium]
MICFALVSLSFVTSFAQAKEKPIEKTHRIQLSISNTTKDLEIMKGSNLAKYISNENSNVKAAEKIINDNLLELYIDVCEKKESYNLISGHGYIIIGETRKNFEFEDIFFKTLESKDGNEFSYGCIKVPNFVSKDEVLLIDVVEMNDFSKVVATTSCGNVENGTGVLFWGELFEEYECFYDMQMSSLKYLDTTSNNYVTKPLGAVSSGRNYEYVSKNKSSSIIGGSGGSGETVIVVVGKRDFRDGNATNGYEMVRVFSRTGNARTYIDGATSAYAVEANIDFTCTTQNMLDISDVSPKATSPSMPKVFNFLSQLHPYIGTTIAAVDLIGYNKAGSVNHTIDSTAGYSFDNHAFIEIDTSTMGDSDINLPSSTTYGDAQNDESHGVTGEIQYQKYMNVSSGSVTAKGRIKYRFYYSTHRYTSAYTNYASVTHTIYNS